MPKSVWWATGLLLGAGAYLLQGQLRQAGGGDVFRTFTLLLIAVITLAMILTLLDLVRPRRRQPIARAMAKARAGHVKEAIADLQRQVKHHGQSSDRAGALGDCYLLQEHWKEAYSQFLEAEQLDGQRGRFLARQGFALGKLGRGSEAIELLEQAARTDGENPSHPWAASLILADLGRYQDAKEHLERAERLVEQFVPPASARRRALEVSLEIGRKRLDAMPAPAPDPRSDSS